MNLRKISAGHIVQRGAFFTKWLFFTSGPSVI